MSRTKAARQSKVRRATKATKAKADKKIDGEKKAKRKGDSRSEQGHKIDAAISETPISLERLAEKSGQTIARVKNHVEWYLEREEGKPGALKLVKGKVHRIGPPPVRRKVTQA